MPASAAERAGAAPGPTAPDPGFGLYVHWPFCRAKCPYCDFNSHVREAVDQSRWRRALLVELEHFGCLAPDRRLTSVFFGGGTPSLMAPETVAAVVARARELWPTAVAPEITLEANPSSVEADRFAAYRAAGVNRVSLGLQSLDDRALRFLGRAHDAAEARAALAVAHRCFDRVSFDLIYALPGQSVAAWRAELARALGLAGEHVSLYQLAIEPNTGFAGAVRRGEWTPPDDDLALRLYDQTQEQMRQAGLPAYEVSNHARAGAACRHNLTYWRYGDYAGIGPGAHGRLNRHGRKWATRQWSKPEAWLEAVEQTGHGGAESTMLEPATAAAEALIMGLRLDEGVDFENFARLVGRPMAKFIDAAALDRLIAAGYLERDVRRLRASAAGRKVLNALLADLLVDSS